MSGKLYKMDAGSPEGREVATHSNGSIDLQTYRNKEEDINNQKACFSTQRSSTDSHSEDIRKSVSFFQLFRFATLSERCMAVFACGCALVAGSAVSSWAYFASYTITHYYALNLTSITPDEHDVVVVGMSKTLALELGIGSVICFLMSAFNMMFCVLVSDRVVNRIRKRAFDNILRQHMGYFDTHNTGDLITRLAEDCNKVQSGMGEKLATSSQWAGQAISACVISFLGDWRLALIAYVLLPISIGAGILSAKASQNMQKKQMDAYGSAGTVAEESLSAIRMVAAFSGEDKQAKRYEDNLAEARKIGVRIGLTTAFGQGFTHFITLFVMALVFWVGGKFHIEGKLDAPGAVLQVMLCSAMSMRAVAWITVNLEFISGARAAAYGIYEIIDHVSEIDSADPRGEKLPDCRGTVTFEDIHFAYPNRRDVQVLKGLTLTIPCGKNVALVGPSGCGKSTTIQLLQRYYDPGHGVVRIDGRDIRDLNTQWVRSIIGVVSQEPVLFAASIEENIRFGRPGATLSEIIACAKEADAHEFINKLPDQYETIINEQGTLLSRGEKQRISLARALLRRPTILLLDECTSALDNESELAVQAALEKASRGRTTITIAHRLSTVRSCDILFVVNEGIVHEYGSHDELVAANGLYALLVSNQMKGEGENEHEEIEERKERSTSLLSSTRSVRSRGSTFSEQYAERLALEQEKTKLPPAPLSRIIKMNAKEWPYLLIGVIASIFMGAGFPLGSIVLGALIKVFGLTDLDEQKAEVRLWNSLMVAIALISAMGAFFALLSLKYAGEWLTQRIRIGAFKCILSQEMGWFDLKEHQVGALTSGLADEAARIQAATGTVIVAVVSGLTTIIGAIIIALVFGWQLGVPMLLLTPVILGVSISQAIVTTKFAQWTHIATMEAGKIIAEVIDKIRVVASLTKEDFFKQKFNSFFDTLQKKQRKKALIIGFTWGCTYMMMGGVFMMCFCLGLFFVAKGALTFENIFRIFYGVGLGTYEFARMNAYALEFSAARAAATEVFALIDRKSKIDPNDPSGIKPTECKGTCAIDNAFFYYPTRTETTVLKYFNIKASRGEFIAMVGPSGSGKSTAVQLFERFYDTIGGIVKVDDHNINDLNIKWMRSQMGIVTQDPILFNISLRENIAFGDNSRDVPMEDIINAAKAANIHSFISSLPMGYETPAGSKGTQLSGGQKQRVSIVRALVRNPKILLLDDATSALDSESEKVVEAALENARAGRTSIVVSHRLSSIVNAHLICYVDKGMVIEKGTHPELMAKKGYYYQLQQANMGLSAKE